jgi:hypothetical protein
VRNRILEEFRKQCSGNPDKTLEGTGLNIVRCSLARLVENSESSQLWRVTRPAIGKNPAILDIYHCEAQTKHLKLCHGGGRGSVLVRVVSILVRNRHAFSVAGFFVRASSPLTCLLRDHTDRAKRLLAMGINLCARRRCVARRPQVRLNIDYPVTTLGHFV